MVKQALKRRNPGFNESYYGFRAFSDLLEEAEKKGLIKLEPDEKSGGYVVTPGLVRPSSPAAADKGIRDVIAPGLKVLFVGINPGLYSAATGHHFARPGNRFWPALHLAGLHAAPASPFASRQSCWTAATASPTWSTAAPPPRTSSRPRNSSPDDAGWPPRSGAIRPKIVAFLGVGAYCHAFGLQAGEDRPAGRSASRARRCGCCPIRAA